MTLLRTEMRRALRRRAVRVLILLGVLGCVLAGVVAFAGSGGKSLAELRLDEEGSPALLADWWRADDGEGFLSIAMFLLILGGFFGGATFAGGEWRSGTVTTVLTWEPRRLRIHGARVAAAGLLALAVSFGLQVLFLASFVPSVLAHGSTTGAGSAFWVALVLAMVRTAAITAVAATLAVGLATLARNTAFAVIAVFAWLAVLEGIIRELKPSLAPWLWGENFATVMIWRRLPDAELARGPVAALATLLLYCAAIGAVAAWSFRRRDIAAAT
jgi:hypothetical protein